MSPKYDIQFVLFNRRRPYVWNKKSYSIIKNSNCLIARYLDVKNKQIEKSIEIGKEQLKKKLDNLLEHEEILDRFFSNKKHSFWNGIKPIFIELCKKRFLEAIQEIELADQVIKNSGASSIIVLSDNGFNEQIMLHLAKKYQIDTLLLQHGMYWETIENKEGNIFIGGDFPILSSKFLTWGTQTEKYSNLEAYEKIIKKVCKIAINLNKRLVIKPHPFQEERDVKKIVEGMDNHVILAKSGNIKDLIKSCDIFLVNDFSTTMLDAMIIGKPVIAIKTKNRHMKERPEIFTSGCCVECNINTLEKEIKEILTTNKRAIMIEKGNQYVKKFMSNQGNSSEKLLEFLDSN